MQKLLFFSRVAFICNICFVLAWAIQYYPAALQRDVSSTIIILGYVASVFINMGIVVVYGIFFMKKRLPASHFPLWLIIANFLFLILQLILALK